MRIIRHVFFGAIGAMLLAANTPMKATREDAKQYAKAEALQMRAGKWNAKASHLKLGLNDLKQWFFKMERDQGAGAKVTKERNKALKIAVRFQKSYQEKTIYTPQKVKNALAQSAEWKRMRELMKMSGTQEAIWFHMNLRRNLLIRGSTFHESYSARENAGKLNRKYLKEHRDLMESIISQVEQIIKK